MNFLTTVLIIASVADKSKADCRIDPKKVYTDYGDLFPLLNECIFDISKFNPKCLLQSCPELETNGRCPYSVDGKLDSVNVTKTFDIINRCFKKSKTICDTPIDRIPAPEMLCDMLQSITGFKLPLFSLQCGLSEENGLAHTYNVPYAQVNIVQLNRNNSITLNIRMNNVSLIGVGYCVLKVNFLLQSLTYKLPKVPVRDVINIEIRNVIYIKNPRSVSAPQKPKVKITIKLDFLHVLTQHLEKGFQIVADIINEPISASLTMIARIWQSKNIAQVAGDFVGTVFAHGFKAAANMHCNHSKHELI